MTKFPGPGATCDDYQLGKICGPTDPDAQYRVLRIDSDPAAEAAWRHYGRLIKHTNPKPAKDIEVETSGVAILKPGWKMPEPPQEPCPECGALGYKRGL